LEGRGFDPCPMLDRSGVKAMPGSMISAPNSGSLYKIRKIEVAKWGTPKKLHFFYSEELQLRFCMSKLTLNKL